MKRIADRALLLSLVLTAALMFPGCQRENSGTPRSESVPQEITQAQTETIAIPEDDGRPRYLTRGTYPGDWTAVVYKGGRDMIYVEDLAAYADTGVTVEVGFTLEERDYYVLAICDAMSWEKLYKLDNSYITGIVPDTEAFDSRQIPLYYVCMQSDGCVSFTVPGCRNAGIDYNINSFTFNITPEGIKYLMERDSKSEGVVLQTYGVNVRYVLLEAEEIDAKIE